METSAKVNEGVEEAFFTLARYADIRIFAIIRVLILISGISRLALLIPKLTLGDLRRAPLPTAPFA
jgi:hypothetical protein